MIRTEDIYKPDGTITYVFLQYEGGVDEGGREATLTLLVCEEVGEGGGRGGQGVKDMGQGRDRGEHAGFDPAPYKIYICRCY
jgi:hypothetical protein